MRSAVLHNDVGGRSPPDWGKLPESIARRRFVALVSSIAWTLTFQLWLPYRGVFPLQFTWSWVPCFRLLYLLRLYHALTPPLQSTPPLAYLGHADLRVNSSLPSRCWHRSFVRKRAGRRLTRRPSHHHSQPVTVLPGFEPRYNAVGDAHAVPNTATMTCQGPSRRLTKMLMRTGPDRRKKTTMGLLSQHLCFPYFRPYIWVRSSLRVAVLVHID